MLQVVVILSWTRVLGATPEMTHLIGRELRGPRQQHVLALLLITPLKIAQVKRGRVLLCHFSNEMENL